MAQDAAQVDGRFTFGLVYDVFTVLESHGYAKGDDRSVGIAMGFLGDLVRAYEGKIDSFREPRAAPETPVPSLEEGPGAEGGGAA